MILYFVMYRMKEGVNYDIKVLNLGNYKNTGTIN